MKISDIKCALQGGALNRYSDIYADVGGESLRIETLLDRFAEHYGDRDVFVLSVPGRSEILGNHTDHNNGVVLAGAIDRDIIAIAAKNDDGTIRFISEGYSPDTVEISKCDDHNNFERYTSAALIAGMVDGFSKNGYSVGGYDVYSNSEVLKGSGISSSAAYEVMIGNIMNQLYNDGKIDNKEIAKIAQYSENVYFGKPSGLMDQMACAVGGFVYIDFEKAGDAMVQPIAFSLKDEGYSLVIVNTGGNHADLNEDYAAVPGEMKGVAAILGKDVLRGLTEDDIIANMPSIRNTLGDRAALRAIHFVRENERVNSAKEALCVGDIDSFLDLVTKSGESSFKYLQNVYTTQNVKEQGLSLALALADGYLSTRQGACRVHGGGFAGTVQVFVKNEDLEDLVSLMSRVFGDGAVMTLNIRPCGAIKLELDNKEI